MVERKTLMDISVPFGELGMNTVTFEVSNQWYGVAEGIRVQVLFRSNYAPRVNGSPVTE